MFLTFDFAFVECCVRTDYKGTKKDHPKNLKIMKVVNNDELVLSSYRVVL
jgi:hypothetical protein